MKKLILLLLTIHSCAESPKKNESNNSENKVGIQFFLDVKYPDQYENAFIKLREQLSPMANGRDMIIAKITERNVMNANYYTLITAKNSEQLKSFLDTVPTTQYHKDYKEKIGLDKGDVKIITTVNVEFK
tara:strand:- start:433 stop:822 length:390 start_codon:yes stop_codon:yes gene_type:complete